MKAEKEEKRREEEIATARREVSAMFIFIYFVDSRELFSGFNVALKNILEKWCGLT